MSFLTIDVGSSSVRAILFDEHLKVIENSIVSRKYNFDVTADGGSTVDVNLLRGLVEECLDEVLKHPEAKAVRAVGMDTFVGNVMGVDANSKPITPIYTYADTRSSDDVALLSKTVDADENLQRTGCPLHTAYHPARLHWLRRTQPELFASVKRWMDFGSYLYAVWFGQSACSYSVASWSGLLNRQNLAWDEEWLKRLELDSDQFPPLADYTAAQTGLTSAYAARWSLLRNIPFYLAVGDGAVANVGTGATTANALAITIGTTAAVRVLYPSPTKVPAVPKGLWSYRLDKDHHLTGGATSEGGNTFHWLQTLFPSLDFEHEQAAIMQRPADSHGLTCLPLFNGERSPGWNSTAAATIHGLRLSTTAADILQATLEGVAMRIALIAGQLPAVPDTIYIGGGAAMSSHVWVQMIANVLNRPVQLVQAPEATAQGVALILAHALDQTALSTYKPVTAFTFTPQPENVTRMKAARDRQRDLYRRLYDPLDK
jgi:gluconokinase